jgi:hypothetical protein
VACALFSFDPPADGFDVQAAQRFVVSFGSEYLHFYALCSGTKAELQDKLTEQLALFNSRQAQFSTLDSSLESIRRRAVAEKKPFDARLVWHLFGMELPLVAIALLSVIASEAAVERTFSAQDAVHTRKRNRLGEETVEAEVFVKFNSKALAAASAPWVAPPPESGCVRLDSGYHSSDCDTDVDLDELFKPVPKAKKKKAAAAAAALQQQQQQTATTTLT